MYNTAQYLCGGPCVQFEQTLGLFDWIGNHVCLVMICHGIQQHRMRRVIINRDQRIARVNDFYSNLKQE